MCRLLPALRSPRSTSRRVTSVAQHCVHRHRGRAFRWSPTARVARRAERRDQPWRNRNESEPGRQQARSTGGPSRGSDLARSNPVRTIAPGLYKWSSGVLISTNVTLSGGPNDVWIFQIAGTLREANGVRVILRGGAQAKNIFWQVAGVVSIGTTARFKGTILAKRNITLNTGAIITGRLLAQTAVTLKKDTVTHP